MTAAMLAVFLLGLVIGLPIATVMTGASIVPGLIDSSFSANISFVLRQIVSGADSLPILAVPMFVLSGEIMAKGKLSEKLFNVFSYFLGNLPGGLPCAVIITCLFYGAISGSGPATCAAVGGMTIPILISLGYEDKFCAALCGTAAGLGVIIPPSIPFVIYGLATGTSVGALFKAGVLPGVLIALCLMAYTIYYCKKHGEDRERVRAKVTELRERGFWHLFKDSFWALLTPVIILGGIYSGIFTPTEAAVVSVFYALIVSMFIYKTIRLRDIITICQSAVNSYGPIILVIALATLLGRVFMLLGVANALTTFISTHVGSKFIFLLLVNIILLILGMFIDVVPALTIIAPLLLPIANFFGVNPVHFGILITVNLAIGFITPPFGCNLFVAARLVDKEVSYLSRMVLPFIAAFIIALVLITYIPWISLAL